jgi:hypothetical protein
MLQDVIKLYRLYFFLSQVNQAWHFKSHFLIILVCIKSVNYCDCKFEQNKFNGTAHFFAFSLITEGAAEKVLQFIMPLKLINCNNICFDEHKNVFLNTTERF